MGSSFAIQIPHSLQVYDITFDGIESLQTFASSNSDTDSHDCHIDDEGQPFCDLDD